MIWNLGSINADNFYYLEHLPKPGETLAATRFEQGLGGKGANMSVAAARAAARVTHIGAVGRDGKWAVDRLLEYGVETQHISLASDPTGHANIAVDAAGENNIILYPGANHAVTENMIGAALSEANHGDFLLMQNETSGQLFAAKTARTLGLRVAYAAAPFSASAVEAVLPYADILILNAVEAAQLAESLHISIEALPVDEVVITLGAEGCKWVSNKAKATVEYPAFPVDAVDTTGAGDTFSGYFIAALDRGFDIAKALDLALRAAALMVGRKGTADVIPDLKEIQDYDFN